MSSSPHSCPWFGLTRGLGWVGNGSKICVFSGLGWVIGLKWQMCEKYMSCIYVNLCRLSTDEIVLWKLAVGASLQCHHLSEIFILCPLTVLFTLYQSRCLVTFYRMFNGFGWVWVGLGHGSISSPGSGLGWVGSWTTLVHRECMMHNNFTRWL